MLKANAGTTWKRLRGSRVWGTGDSVIAEKMFMLSVTTSSFWNNFTLKHTLQQSLGTEIYCFKFQLFKKFAFKDIASVLLGYNPIERLSMFKL